MLWVPRKYWKTVRNPPARPNHRILQFFCIFLISISSFQISIYFGDFYVVILNTINIYFKGSPQLAAKFLSERWSQRNFLAIWNVLKLDLYRNTFGKISISIFFKFSLCLIIDALRSKPSPPPAKQNTSYKSISEFPMVL